MNRIPLIVALVVLLEASSPPAAQTADPQPADAIIGGAVRRVVGSGAFILEDQHAAGSERLVLAPDAEATPVVGAMVVVRGVVRRFAQTELDAIRGWTEIDPAIRREFAERPILLATSLNSASGRSLMRGASSAVRPFARRSPVPSDRARTELTLHPAALVELIDAVGGRPVSLFRARVVALLNPRAMLIESANPLLGTVGNLDRVLVLVGGGELRVDAASIVDADVTVTGTARTLLGARVTGEVAWPRELTPEVVKRLEIGAAVLATSIRTADGVELTAAAVAAAAAQTRPAAPVSAKAAVYASVGEALTQYDINAEDGTLTKRATVTLPANVQEGALHPSRQYLYVAWSSTGASYGDQGSAGAAPRHGVTAFRIDAASGALRPHGTPAPLRARPIHLTTDADGRHLIVAYNLPSGVSVHRLEQDGTVGAEVVQTNALDGGIYGHHVRVLPSNRGVVLVTRGNAPTETSPEDPGALKVFTQANGVLANRASIAPGRGYGFQARHIDFHPSRPWAYLTLERQNQIAMFHVADDSLSPAPVFVKTTLAEPGSVRPGQTTSTIRVHPDGRFVYVGNRASGTTEFQGKRVAAGGENTIAVFAIDPSSGEPMLIQTIDTRGFQPRTFALDPAGRVLVVGNQNPLMVREGSATRRVPASLTTFRVGAGGTLTFARTYEVDARPEAGRLLFWTGIAPYGG